MKAYCISPPTSWVQHYLTKAYIFMNCPNGVKNHQRLEFLPMTLAKDLYWAEMAALADEFHWKSISEGRVAKPHRPALVYFRPLKAVEYTKGKPHQGQVAGRPLLPEPAGAAFSLQPGRQPKISSFFWEEGTLRGLWRWKQLGWQCRKQLCLTAKAHSCYCSGSKCCCYFKGQ